MTGRLQLVSFKDKILKEKSLVTISGFISSNVFSSPEEGVLVYTSKIKLFNKAKYIFLILSSDSYMSNSIPINEIIFWKDTGRLFSTDICHDKCRFMVSSEFSKELEEYRLKHP